MDTILMPYSDREFGQLDERVKTLQGDMSILRAEVGTNTALTNRILLKISSLEGSWKALLLVATVAAAIGGLAVKLLPLGMHL